MPKKKEPKEKKPPQAKPALKSVDSYSLDAEGTSIKVDIRYEPKDFVLNYHCSLPQLSPQETKLLENIQDQLIRTVRVNVEEIVDPKSFEDLKTRYKESAKTILTQRLPNESPQKRAKLQNALINKMLGLGPLEPLFFDENIEEIVVNNSEERVGVYHKKHGWLHTNIKTENESQIHNYASVIGRRVGKVITNLNPLMDARLPTGDRVNATLFPISTKGNTITIRKFARRPWTVIDFIDPKVNSLSIEIASLLWFALQNELNLLVAGGTGSGKTSMLNALTPFIPANQRVISIEDTRELQLPKYLHWIPMVTRSPNPEGKGKIEMLDLMVNSLRMRPDRIIVGEVRRDKEAEVLFEAMHTGHSVYSTFHADSVAQTYRRLVNQPIAIQPEVLESLHLILVQFRQRRLNIRRTFEVAEVEEPEETADGLKMKLNLLYKWNPTSDKIDKVNDSMRINDELKLRSGMNDVEIAKNLKEKQEILSWMLKHNIRDINDIGKIVSTYYINPDGLTSLIKKGEPPGKLVK